MGKSVDGGYYDLAPGTDVVTLEESAVLFKSDTVVLRLEGESASVFQEKILPLLDGRKSLQAVASHFPGLSFEELRDQLDELVTAGILRRSESPQQSRSGSLETGFAPALDRFWNALDALGLPLEQAKTRLATMKVVVFGLEAHGAHVADLLARAGVGDLKLVDPFPLHPGDQCALPLGVKSASDSRQDSLQAALEQLDTPTRIEVHPGADLNRGEVLSSAEGADFLVGCFDRGFSAAHQWINRASLELGIPAVFGEIWGHRLLAGPLVLPGEGACLLCWKMRSAACQEEFKDVMAYEEYLDRQRQPEMHRRPAFPVAAPVLGGILAMEILKTTLAFGRPALAGRIQEIDLLSSESTFHPLLQRPDCPACKKKTPGPQQPALDHLKETAIPNQDPVRLGRMLVSRHCGIVRGFQQVMKDPGEPRLPLVYRAELANHRFLEEKEEAFIVSSGKGMTAQESRMSALGEALERYCASAWSDENIVYKRREELEGPSLDPRRLVLFRPEQYASLKYAPYQESSRLGWVPARSLASGEQVWVPALAAFMAYDVRSPEEFLFPITSNGLAAGPSLPRAILSAVYEVLERDAFLAMWLHSLPCQRISPFSHPQPEVQGLCHSYARRRVAMELYRIPMDHSCHVFAGIAFSEGGPDGPASVVGLGADLDPVRAARSAVLEVSQVRPALRIRMREAETRRHIQELVDDPSRVATLEDHDLLYADSSTTACFDFLRRRPLEEFDWDQKQGHDPVEDLSRLTDELRGQGSDILYCNLTTSEVQPLGIHVVRAIVPDYQPIYFGRQERRIGGERLFELPRRLGIRPDRAGLDDLNPNPHPLA